MSLACRHRGFHRLFLLSASSLSPPPFFSSSAVTRASSVRNMAASSHYENHTSDSYEKAYFYEPGAYMQHLVDLVSRRLKLHSNDHRVILDIGGGTGNFAQALVEKYTKSKAIVVDPFLDPSNTSVNNNNVKFVKEPAEAFLKNRNDEKDWWRKGYNQVLLKEIVHHLKPQDRIGIFRGMHQEIKSSTEFPSILIITRPQVEIDYPLWDQARQVWKENQPSSEQFQDELVEAGFVNIQQTIEAYPCQISLERWQTMIQNRFWSTFSKFTDAQLKEACQQIAKDYPTDQDGTLHFEDRLVFISAYTGSS